MRYICNAIRKQLKTVTQLFFTILLLDGIEIKDMKAKNDF